MPSPASDPAASVDGEAWASPSGNGRALPAAVSSATRFLLDRASIAFVAQRPDTSDLPAHVVALLPQNRTHDEHLRAELSAQQGRVAIHSPVHVDLTRDRAAAEEIMCRQDLGSGFLDERLAAQTRLHGHHHHDVDEVAVRLEGRKRRVWPDRQTGGAAGAMDRPECRFDRLVDFDVKGDRVAAGVDEIVDVAAGLRDHQVRVEWLPTDTAQLLDDARPEGDVGDEMAVHDVEVDAVGAGFQGPAALLGQVGQVGIEDAGGYEDPPFGGRPGHQRDSARRATIASRLDDTASWLRSPRRAASLWRTINSRRWATAGAGAAPARAAASGPRAAPASWPRWARIVPPPPWWRTRAANSAIRSGLLAC